MIAYAVIGIALVLFVQARDVFPQLLVIRLLFSVGAAGVSTMITAILPSIIADRELHISSSPTDAQNGRHRAASNSSETTVTPDSVPEAKLLRKDPAPTRSAGLVGIFSGCGALLALLLFLRLPDLIQGRGVGMYILLSPSPNLYLKKHTELWVDGLKSCCAPFSIAQRMNPKSVHAGNDFF